MDRGIGPDRIVRKAAQQVCGALAGSPEEALLWFEGRAHTHTHVTFLCVRSAAMMLMVGFTTAGHFLSVRRPV